MCLQNGSKSIKYSLKFQMQQCKRNIYQEQDDKQNSDHLVRKNHVEYNSDADPEHEHWLEKQCQIIVDNGHI